MRRGLMLIGPENISFLGGSVAQLEAAAQFQRQKTAKRCAFNRRALLAVLPTLLTLL